jgi:hypothetical protein
MAQYNLGSSWIDINNDINYMSIPVYIKNQCLQPEL